VRRGVIAQMLTVPVSLLLGAHAAAQTPVEPAPQPVVRASDAGILGAAAAVSIVLMKYDVRITAWKGMPAFRNSSTVHHTLDAAAFIGGPGSLAIEAGLFGAGRIASNKNLATDGAAALEAAAASGVVTYLLKGTIGRARPYVDSTRADNFGFARGFFGGGDYQSFPSGHTTSAFAFATAITARLSERGSSSVGWAAPVLFSVASLTAIARVYDHKHWTSDVLMGAAIGTVSGLVAARWNERHP
jgi:membrane-associated phospholipid phosphatase